MHPSISPIESCSNIQKPFAIEVSLSLLFAWILRKAFLPLSLLSAIIMAIELMASIVLCGDFVSDDHVRLTVWTATSTIKLLMLIAARFGTRPWFWCFCLSERFDDSRCTTKATSSRQDETRLCRSAHPLVYPKLPRLPLHEDE